MILWNFYSAFLSAIILSRRVESMSTLEHSLANILSVLCSILRISAGLIHPSSSSSHNSNITTTITIIVTYISFSFHKPNELRNSFQARNLGCPFTEICQFHVHPLGTWNAWILKFQSYISITFIDSLDKGIRGLFVFEFFSQDSIELGIFYCRYEFIFNRE